jgi:hypothetical protein
MVGYGLAGTVFAVLVVLLLTIWRDRMRGSLLPVACVAGALWGSMLVYFGTQAAVAGLFGRVACCLARSSCWPE